MAEEDADGDASDPIADLFDEHVAKARGEDARDGVEEGPDANVDEDDGGAVHSGEAGGMDETDGDAVPEVADGPTGTDTFDPYDPDRYGASASEADGQGHSERITASGGVGGIDESKLDADDGGPAVPPDVAIDRAGPDAGRLSTGVDALDHHMGGGLPPGRIVSFVATADTQSELLVKQLASRHDCLYLSTLRPKWEVEEEVTDHVQKSGAVDPGRSVRIEQLPPDSRLDTARRYLEELGRRSILVVDSANELERLETERYAYFVDEVKRTLWETGSVGLFYCIEEEQPPAGRAVTLRRADVIWRLRRSAEEASLRHQLLVSKFRGGRALTEPLALWLTDEVVVDDS